MMNNFHIKILFINILIFSINYNSQSQITRINLGHKFPEVKIEKLLWIGTEEGLINYNTVDDSFRKMEIGRSKDQPEVHDMMSYQDWLFCVLDTGLAVVQVKLNDILLFDTTNGLPGSIVNNVDFLNDFAWVATSGGMARFDLLTERWEAIDSSRGYNYSNIADLKVFNGEVWTLSGNYLIEYDPSFEKARVYELPEAGEDLIILSDQLWIRSEKGFTRFFPESRTMQDFFFDYINSGNIIEIFIEGSQAWIVSKKGIFTFDKSADMWKEFEGNNFLKDGEIRNAYLSQSELWILTGKNVLIWNRNARTWEIQDYSTGLERSDFDYLYTDGEVSILRSKNLLNYRQSAAQSWKIFELWKGSGEESFNDFFKNLFDNPKGGAIDFGPYKLSLQGSKVRFSQDYRQEFPDGDGSSIMVGSPAYRLDIKSQFQIDESRRIAAFYNNIDYSETIYGIRYRGKDKDSTTGDLLRELSWGDFYRENENKAFIDKSNLFGNNIWLQYGSKSKMLKRPLFSLRASTGEIRSRKTFESFNRIAAKFESKIKDTDYLKNRFYPIGDSSANPASIELFIDDLNTSNNTPNTLIKESIAGITGDYDKLNTAEDFGFVTGRNLVYLQVSIKPGWILTARYKSGSRTIEEILQDGSGSSRSVMNGYSIKGRGIIPYTLRLKIVDSLGSARPLSDFGLASSVEGIPDSKFIDYEFGWLFFPDSMPFNTDVYIPDSAKSNYTITATFETSLPMIQLTHGNLVRGSDILRLDGIIAAGGNDYILDYTNGTIVFVREGVLNPDTRIEVEYEFYESYGNHANDIELSYSPSDFITIKGDWQKNSSDTTHLLSINAESRAKLGNFDLRLFPAFVYQTLEKSITGLSFEGMLSSEKIRIQANYQNYGNSYRNIYMPETIFGRLRNQMRLNGSWDAMPELRLTAEALVQDGFVNDSASRPFNNNYNIGLLFQKKYYPALKFVFQNMKSVVNDSAADKFFLQNLLDYQIPKEFTDMIHIIGMRLENYFRWGREKNFNSGHNEFLQTYLRLNTFAYDQVQANIFWRYTGLSDHITSKKLQQSGRVSFDASQEYWRLLQMNLRLENNLQQMYHADGSGKDFSFRQFFQVNFRFSPGQLAETFSPLFFEFNYNHSMIGSGTTANEVSSYLWSFKKDDMDGRNSQSGGSAFFIRNEFRPSSKFILYSLSEWSNQQSALLGSATGSKYWRWEEKLDLRFGLSTHIIAQWKQYNREFDAGTIQTDMEPVLWIEQRWSEDIINIANISLRKSKIQDRAIGAITHNLKFEYNFIWRKEDFIGIRFIELRQALGAGVISGARLNDYNSYQLSSSTSVDLYPLQSLIIRFRIDAARFRDLQRSAGNYIIIAENLKITLQF